MYSCIFRLQQATNLFIHVHVAKGLYTYLCFAAFSISASLAAEVLIFTNRDYNHEDHALHHKLISFGTCIIYLCLALFCTETMKLGLSFCSVCS